MNLPTWPVSMLLAVLAVCGCATYLLRLFFQLKDAWREERVALIEKAAKESAAAVLKMEQRVRALEHAFQREIRENAG
jgi:hypothetical protein